MKNIPIFILFLISASIAAQCLNDQYKAILDVGFIIEEINKRGNEKSTLPIQVVSIYIETDFYTYNALGQQGTIDWIEDRYWEIASIYAGHGISTSLTSYYFPENVTSDWSGPYINNPFDLLNRFGELRKDQPHGRLKHFLSIRGLSQGIAWINTLESDYVTFMTNQGVFHAGPYAVSLGLTTFSSSHPNNWSRIVTTHEMAHNIGSRHSFDCVWGNGSQQIDRCNGISCSLSPLAELNTIMSYCSADWQVGFGDEIGNLIRSKFQNATRDLSGGFTPILMYLSGDLSGDFTATKEVRVFTDSTFNNSQINID